MPRDLAFSCRCGSLAGVLHDASPRSGCHLICYCADCRAFARHMGVADRLTPGGGSQLFQALPAKIGITKGAELVACLRLSPKGLHRWYAACCNTPLANTVGTPKVPLAGLWVPLFADPAALGPVVTLGFTKMALKEPGAPKKDRGLVRMLGGLLMRSAASYADGTARISPFFTADGTPVVAPKVIDPAAKAAAYAA
ncbi:DUF6151 family protein [Oceaniglobus roseus]|uniref:DUF6151 family protein n=1 Tax=Oceaniglobus roseus TaxID=1737570 RepID=UPI000C7E8E2E|nr:DUF6151 family protein [Kandeliimicrobium roseum]